MSTENAIAALTRAAVYLEEQGIDPYQLLRDAGAQDRKLRAAKDQIVELERQVERLSSEKLERLLSALEGGGLPLTPEGALREDLAPRLRAAADRGATCGTMAPEKNEG